MDETYIERLEKFINRHKVVITATVAVATTFTVAAMLSRMGQKQMLDFIKEHDLYDEYIATFDEV